MLGRLALRSLSALPNANHGLEAGSALSMAREKFYAVRAGHTGSW